MSAKREMNWLLPVAVFGIALLGALRHADAGLTWKETTVEIEAGKQDKTATAIFEVTNTGNDPISATVLRLPHNVSVDQARLRSIRPGQSRQLRVTYKIGRSQGTVHHKVRLITDEVDSDPHELEMRVKVPRIVKIKNARALVWHVGDKPEPKTLELEIDYDQPVKMSLGAVRQMQASRPRNEADAPAGDQERSAEAAKPKQQPQPFKIELKPLEEGKRYAVTVTPQSTELRALAWLELKTDLPKERAPMLRFRAEVRPKPKPIKPTKDEGAKDNGPTKPAASPKAE